MCVTGKTCLGPVYVNGVVMATFEMYLGIGFLINVLKTELCIHFFTPVIHLNCAEHVKYQNCNLPKGEPH